MNIQILKLADLNPAKYNPRKMLTPGDPEFEKLKKSIQNFGYVELIVVNSRTSNTVISGHQRLSVLKDLGAEEAECVVVDLDEAAEKALNVAMNKISGEWDKDKLALLITDLQAEDFDVSLTGFDPAEIDDLFKSQTKDGVHEDEFDVDAEMGKPVFTKFGDIWKLGKHKVICGDSTKPETYEALLLDEKVNLVITDPPYNANYKAKAGSIQNDHMKSEAFYTFLLDAFSCMHDVMASDASIYVFHADMEGLNFRKAFDAAGFKLAECCIWMKQRFTLGHSPYQWQHEPVLYGWRKDGRHQWYGGRKESTIWQFDMPRSSKEHPTMKPVELCAYPIMNTSLTNSIVLDPFGGSGSTLIACEQTSRICRMIELDPKYCDVIVNRYLEAAGSSTGITCQRDGITYTYEEINLKDSQKTLAFNTLQSD